MLLSLGAVASWPLLSVSPVLPLCSTPVLPSFSPACSLLSGPQPCEALSALLGPFCFVFSFPSPLLPALPALPLPQLLGAPPTFWLFPSPVGPGLPGVPALFPKAAPLCWGLGSPGPQCSRCLSWLGEVPRVNIVLSNHGVADCQTLLSLVIEKCHRRDVPGQMMGSHPNKPETT